MTSAEKDHANWDLTSYFPEFDGPDYQSGRAVLARRIDSTQQEARRLAGSGLRVENLDEWKALILDLEELSRRASHIGSYLGCLAAADALDEKVQQELGSLQATMAGSEKTWVLVGTSFKDAGETLFERFVALQGFEGCRYFLRRLRRRAAWTMDTPLEELAADLNVTGFSAWGRLYSQLAGRLEFDLDKNDGSRERVPMSLRNSLLENQDPTVRKAALEGSNRAWAGVEHVAAACLNAISGTRLALYERRGVGHFLEPALLDSGISRATLEALLGAVRSRQEVPRSFLSAKARLIGKAKVGWQDIHCPLPLEDAEPVSWSGAKNRLLVAFGGAYPALAEFTRHAFDHDWIESEPRSGKSPGGFCTSSLLTRESRVFMTFNRTLGDVQTLAHELGHAFHNWVMRDMRPYARRYPMTLAETASTFAETLFTDAVLENPETSDNDRATILDTRMSGAAAFLLDIPMRFDFENELYERRRSGEIAPGQLKEMMLAAQRRNFGDCLAEDEMDPYFWASKLHFYITSVSFYNFPYTFGFLFSLGVYARARAEGRSFLARYEELLRLTGSDTAENVARRAIDADLESEDFWLESIGIVEEDMRRFEQATMGLAGSRR